MAKNDEVQTVDATKAQPSATSSKDTTNKLAEVNPAREDTSVVLRDGDDILTFVKGDKYDVKASLLTQKDGFGVEYLTEVKNS